ncbi:DUF2946 family protein [uncultured Hyphomonas sp.]|jgi:hypothetical protein|uniref:DUF2946 family protein n=1 Tax=uncultured Hyphomonas sp. TaxID=225298 RepID=UPI0030D6E5EA|tara:strand:+ start:1115 stop:1534 length:420 start_codon:yes stop_codon:yes gene_type:complete
MPALFRHLRLFALLLLVAGLGVRGAVPAGYMVDTADNGGIIIRICGDGAGSLMRLDPEAGTLEELPADFDPHAPADTDASDTSTCPFALTAAFDLPPAPALPAPAAFGLPRLGASLYVLPLTQRPIDTRLPARGPPLSA